MLRHATASLLLGAGAAVAAQELPAQELPTQVLAAQELPAQQSHEDAWWTGPMLAANGATLPQGHALIEPYLFNIITRGHFDTNGNKHAGPLEHDLGSLTYMLYGVTDNFTSAVVRIRATLSPPAVGGPRRLVEEETRNDARPLFLDAERAHPARTPGSHLRRLRPR